MHSSRGIGFVPWDIGEQCLGVTTDNGHALLSKRIHSNEEGENVRNELTTPSSVTILTHVYDKRNEVNELSSRSRASGVFLQFVFSVPDVA